MKVTRIRTRRLFSVFFLNGYGSRIYLFVCGLNMVGCCSSIEEKKSTSFPSPAFGVEAGTLVEATGCAFGVDKGGFSEIVAGDYKT
jgi:hypothetical protein